LLVSVLFAIKDRPKTRSIAFKREAQTGASKGILVRVVS
jgi:hypothetical protein